MIRVGKDETLVIMHQTTGNQNSIATWEEAVKYSTATINGKGEIEVYYDNLGLKEELRNLEALALAVDMGYEPHEVLIVIKEV